MRILLALAVTVVLLCAGCAPKSAANNKADVEKAVHDYLAKKGMAESMKVEVGQVQYQGDTAEASVVLSAKTNPDAKMAVTYTLKRTAPGSWEVQGRKEGAAGADHGNAPAPGGPMGMPAGQPSGAMNPPGAPAASPHGMGQMPPASAPPVGSAHQPKPAAPPKPAK
jgi:hypothetical protein